MTAALTAIEPYQPLPGIPMRDSLARAHEHIGRTEKFVERTQKAAAKILEKHEALQGVVHRVGANYQKLGVSALHAMGAGAIGGDRSASPTVDGVASEDTPRNGGSRSTWAVAVAGTRCQAPFATCLRPQRRPAKTLLRACCTRWATRDSASGAHRWGHETSGVTHGRRWRARRRLRRPRLRTPTG